MMPGEIVAAGAIGVAAGHAERLTTPPDDTQEKQREVLENMLHVLTDLHNFLRANTIPEATDIFKIQPLYKAGQGPNWIPSKEHRQYLRVLATQPTAVLVSSPLGPPVTITIPVVALPNFWLPWDWPDQSSFILDPTATANQLNIYVRITRVAGGSL